jgi:hypothetical protein
MTKLSFAQSGDVPFFRSLLDRAGLEDASCECYGTIQRVTKRLLAPPP